MSKFKTAVKLLKENKGEFMASLLTHFFKWLPDATYLKLLYRFKMGHRLDLKNPRTFTEKIQWLKLYNRKSEYTTMVDKYAVKQYVAERIGAEHIIPTLGVWDKPEEIDWDVLPDQFVLKTTHGGGGGGVVICKDKVSFNRQEAVATLNKSLASDIYSTLREWPYRNVPKRIIAERFMAPQIVTHSLSGISNERQKNIEYDELKDYKFFCFSGKVKFFKVDFGRFVEHHANYYSPDGVIQEFGEKDVMPVLNYSIELPDNLKDMILLAEKLSENEPFLRVDLYNIKGKIYFGELTFYPASGLGRWTSDEVNVVIGNFLKLANNEKKNKINNYNRQ